MEEGKGKGEITGRVIDGGLKEREYKRETANREGEGGVLRGGKCGPERDNVGGRGGGMKKRQRKGRSK